LYCRLITYDKGQRDVNIKDVNCLTKHFFVYLSTESTKGCVKGEGQYFNTNSSVLSALLRPLMDVVEESKFLSLLCNVRTSVSIVVYVPCITPVV
jgi:hypothetical protein